MSTFTDIRDTLVKMGLPLLGAALPVPGGAALGAALAAHIGAASSSPADIALALASPEALEKAHEFELTHQEMITRITVDAEIRAVEAVNRTMQSEAASDHWPTYSWRPFLGFSAGFIIIFSYIVAPTFELKPVPIDAQVWLFLTAVLGVASYFRGKAQADPNVPTDNRG